MEEEKKSRTQIKNEMLELQKIGKRLIGLPEGQLGRIPLGPELLSEIAFARDIRSHGARRRHERHIGALLRAVDMQPIHQALRELDEGHHGDARAFQGLEKWRDALIAGNDELIEQILAQHPAAERQRLRNLVREARRERARDKGVRAARALFRYLREIAGTAPDGTGAQEFDGRDPSAEAGRDDPATATGTSGMTEPAPQPAGRPDPSDKPVPPDERD